MKVVRSTGATDFCEQLRRTGKETLFNPRSAAVFRENAEIEIGLGRCCQKKSSRVVAGLATWCLCLVVGIGRRVLLLRFHARSIQAMAYERCLPITRPF